MSVHVPRPSHEDHAGTTEAPGVGEEVTPQSQPRTVAHTASWVEYRVDGRWSYRSDRQYEPHAYTWVTAEDMARLMAAPRGLAVTCRTVTETRTVTEWEPLT